MRKQIQKSFIECFPKNPNVSKKQTQSPPRSCWPSKLPSFADATVPENVAVSLSDTDQFLFQNIRSFYRKQCEEEMAKIGREATPQLASPRSSSGLIVKKTCTSAADEPPVREADAAEEIGVTDLSTRDDFIAILTYSQSPHEDFRRSMQEMVEAHLELEGEVDREFMEELLFRYLDLNNEKFYGSIVRAFLDLIVVSREGSGRIPARRRSWIGGGGRRKLKLEIKRMRRFCHK